MKQLTCEMCGSTNILKQDGIFVCQTCGCKYSVEEAKKMMIEGTDSVTIPLANNDSHLQSKQDGKRHLTKPNRIVLIASSIVMSLIIVITFITAIIPSVRKKTALNKYGSMFSSAAIGEYIKFGQYEQDNNLSNGKEDIEWLILSKEHDRILIISKYALDYKSYNSLLVDVTWETSTLRQWLNETFLNDAFSKEEQSIIQKSTVLAEKNRYYTEVDAGKDVNDKIFLLSMTELDQYFPSKRSARSAACLPTQYAIEHAIEQGKYNFDVRYTYKIDGKYACEWWLRTLGDDQCSAAYVSSYGSLFEFGTDINNTHFVRPAMWIEI